jgi:tRNA pseudouridine55 synthase
MDGVLVIDKPKGPTSHDIVAQIRKALREKKVGHTGTLDPVATGVLPLVLGSATKIARYLSGGDKTYRATLRLGVTTTTLDSEGEQVQERQVTCSEADVRRVVGSFVGAIDQIPPMYSAKKMQGTRLYELARQGVEIEREAKRVHIYESLVVSVDLPEVTVDVRCSAGTYVRVLAQDVGERLGCGGHLSALRRLAAGPFTLADGITIEELVENPDAARSRILPMTRALGMLPRIDVPPDIGRMIADGYQLCVADLRTLDTPEFATDATLALGLDGGDVIAVARSLIASSELSTLRRDQRALKTERVLSMRRQ